MRVLSRRIEETDRIAHLGRGGWRRRRRRGRRWHRSAGLLTGGAEILEGLVHVAASAQVAVIFLLLPILFHGLQHIGRGRIVAVIRQPFGLVNHVVRRQVLAFGGIIVAFQQIGQSLAEFRRWRGGGTSA